MRIGIFDSGIGGITVLTELQRRFSGDEFVYFGDTANVPYGSKSPAHIIQLAVECAKSLQAKRIDALVVACNTASSVALPAIRKAVAPIPVFGVLEPGVEAVLKELSVIQSGGELCSPVLVLATSATIRSQAYGKALRSALVPDHLPTQLPLPIIEQACPLLVPMIEEGWINHPILHETISEYVTPHIKNYPVGVALLGCTHYPWIHLPFEKALSGWKVINSAEAVSEALHRSGKFVEKRMDRPQLKKVEWIFSDPEAVPRFARDLIEGQTTS